MLKMPRLRASTDPSLDLLRLEFNYVTQSSLHTDDLRDRFIQYYLILVGAAFTVMLGLAQLDNTTVHPWYLRSFLSCCFSLV